MGNTNTRITCNFDRSVNFTNEPVTGHVHLDLEKNENYSNINSIYVIIKGMLRHELNQNTQPLDIFTSRQYILASPQQPGAKLNFTQGHYSWPFSVPITEYLPPSFQTQAERFYYYLEVIFERPWFQRNISYLKQIIICPHVNLQQIPKNPLVFGNYKQNSNEIIINGKLNKSAFIWGENMKFKLEIFNTKRLLIKNINISIFYTVQIIPRSLNLTRSNKFINTIFEQTVPSIENTHEEMISKSFEMQIPRIYSPPSFNYSCYVSGHRIRGSYVLSHTRIINIHHTLKISLKVQGILTDVDLTAPITIGTIAQSDGEETRLTSITHPDPTDDTNICDDKE